MKDTLTIQCTIWTVCMLRISFRHRCDAIRKGKKSKSSSKWGRLPLGDCFEQLRPGMSEAKSQSFAKRRNERYKEKTPSRRRTYLQLLHNSLRQMAKSLAYVFSACHSQSLLLFTFPPPLRKLASPIHPWPNYRFNKSCNLEHLATN